MPAFEILKSEKNRDVLLVEGFLFWFDRATPKGRKYWKCIYCYRGYDGDVKNKCLSRVITSPNDPVAIICKNHNHCRDTVLVEHMKAFGSIRRLASSLRNPTSRKASISPATSTNSTPEENIIPSTSEPLDLSIPTKRPSSTQPLTLQPSSPPKVPKKSKRALADVLETLYNRLQKQPTPNENSTLQIIEEKESKNVEEKTKKNLSNSNATEKIPSSLFPSPTILTPQLPSPTPPPPPPPQRVIDLSVTGQPGLANPNLPYRLSSSWLTLAAMSNIFTSTYNNNHIITSQPTSYIPK